MITETREKILAAVETALDKEPGLSFSIESIAKLAGVSRGGLLYHFKTKESLLVGLVDRFVARFDSAVEIMMQEKKVRYCRAYAEVSIHPESVKSIRAIIGVACVDERLLGTLKTAYHRWQNQLAQDLGDKTKALNLRLAIDGYSLASIGDLEVPDFKEINLVLKSIDSSIG